MNNSIATTSNSIVFSSTKLLFLVSNSFMNFTYVGIWSKVSGKWILIWNLLRISRNLINYLYSSLMEHVDKVNRNWSTLLCILNFLFFLFSICTLVFLFFFLLFSLTLNFSFLVIFILTRNQIVTNPPLTTIPLLIVITLQCSLGLVYVLADYTQLCCSANFVATYPTWVSKVLIVASLFIWLA